MSAESTMVKHSQPHQKPVNVGYTTYQILEAFVDLDGEVLLDQRVVLGREGGEVGSILILARLWHTDSLLNTAHRGLKLLRGTVTGA